MRTLGFIGGMSPPSTAIYYNQINNHVRLARGGSTSAPMVLHSLDHSRMHTLFAAEDWNTVASVFTQAALHMRDAGCKGIAIGCNIGHRVAQTVQDAVGLPVLHIADYTAAAIVAKGLKKKVGLLATQPVMEERYIKDRLKEQIASLGVGEQIEVLVPERQEERDAIQKAIATELAAGISSGATKELMRRATEGLIARGAEGVVLACTDLQFVVSQEDYQVPLFDTLELHARGLAEWILARDD